MRHFGKRGFALLLALMLCLSLFPSALAEDAGSIAAAEDAPEQEVTIAPAEEGTIAPAEEGSIRPAEDGDALPGTDETQDGDTSGQCGDDLTWSFDETTGTLTITGRGDMWNWSSGSVPWYSLRASIKSVELSGGLTRIGSYAFSNLSGLTSVTIPNTVRIIDRSAFSYCSSLISLIIPGSVQTIGMYAFQDCYSLTSVTIQEGCDSIGSDAFESCTKLDTIRLPGSLRSLSYRYSAFGSCTALRDIYFGGTEEVWNELGIVYDHTVITIHCTDGDFLPVSLDDRRCGDNLTWTVEESTGTLTISGSGDMWDWWNWYRTIPVSHESNEYANYAYPGFIRNVIFPDGLTHIGNASFQDCGNLSSITLPSSVRSIGKDAFRSCSALSSVQLSDGLQKIGDFAFSSCRRLTEIIIPDGVNTIGIGAFSGCIGLTSIHIPESVTSIGASTFVSCSGLTDVTIPEGVVSIESAAFANCSGLVEVSIPVSAIKIDTNAFSRSSNLKDIYYGGTAEDWNRLNLSYDRGKVTVHCVEGIIEPNTDTNRCGENLFWTLENGTLTITGTGEMWNYEVYNDSSYNQLSTAPWYSLRDTISHIYMAEGVTSIGNYAFSTYNTGGWTPTSFDNLTILELPDTLERIGICGLAGLNNLREVILPSSLIEIDECAFVLSSFKELEFPQSLTTIGTLAFYGSSLQRLTFPSKVSKIGDAAFQGASINEIRFLGDPPAISLSALSGISATAYYPQNNPTWTKSVLRGYGGGITWVGYVPTGGTLSIGNREAACVGRQFTVDLMLDENPGVMMLSFRLEYDDDVMEFLGAEDGVFSGWNVNASKNALEWDSDQDRTETGTLLRLRFRVKEDAAPGEGRIGIKDVFAGNYNEEQLYFETGSGIVTLIPHLAGDANGDGKVNGNDLIRLRKYLAGSEKEIIEGNADVNADAIVDILDLVRLRKYFTLEDVILE